MLYLPTIVLEGKVYWPTLSDQLKEDCFLVRAAEQDDNVVVGQAVADAAERLGYRIRFDRESLARSRGALKAQTVALGKKIERLGKDFQMKEYSQEKIEILAELAKLVSEDGAGVSFMSNGLHELIGGVGMNPGSSAVLSHIVPRSYYEEYVMPFATEHDVNDFVLIVKAAVEEVNAVKEHAQRDVDRLDCVDKLDALILKG